MARGRGGEEARTEAGRRFAVHLLGDFAVTEQGRDVAVPACSRRVVALLALRRRPLERGHAAGVLWLDKDEARAKANLRSALWRLRATAPGLVTDAQAGLALGPGTAVDVEDAQRLAHDLIDDRCALDLGALDTSVLDGDLLPGWYDDFVENERERLRQLRLHALEALARRLGQGGQVALAIEAALGVISIEPLRESAHRAVIELHLAEGNPAEALRQYRRMEALLREALGIRPSPSVRDLVASMLPGRAGLSAAG